MAIRDEIAALYQSILKRPADEAGLNYFTNAVTSGAGTLADVARDMRASAEVQGSQQGGLTQDGIGKYSYNPSDTYDAISNLYQNILGRKADQAGLDYFAKAVMTRQGTLADVERDLRASAEAQGLLGTATPVTPVTTTPATTGLLQTPVVPAGMSADAARSYVSGLYTNDLKRQADAAGLDYWANLLTSGRATPAEVRAGIMGSPEAQGVQAGVRQVPFGSQAVGGNVYQVSQMPSMAQMPSIQNAFQQALQYQAALPYMIPQFNPAEIPPTYQQIAGPRQRLDISNIQMPQWLIDAAAKDEARMDAAAEGEEKAVTPVDRTSSVTTTQRATTTAGIPDWIVNTYASALGRAPETAGANYWASQAAAGVPVADLIATIQGSPEAQAYRGGGLLGK